MKYLLIAIVAIFIGCKTAETSQTSNLVNSKTTWLTTPSFEISFKMAYPFVTNEMNQIAASNLLGAGNSANQINLLGRGDFLKVSEQTVEANMSYYGTQRFGTFNSGNTGIILNDPIEDYTYSFNENKGSSIITFKASHGLEHYEFKITVYKSGKCRVDVNSSKRNFITYDGVLEELEIQQL